MSYEIVIRPALKLNPWLDYRFWTKVIKDKKLYINYRVYKHLRVAYIKTDRRDTAISSLRHSNHVADKLVYDEKHPNIFLEKHNA